MVLPVYAIHGVPITGVCYQIGFNPVLVAVKDVSAADVLADVVVAHRLGDVAPAASSVATERDWAEGKERGSSGRPYFFTPGGAFLCPALDVRRLDGHLRIDADPEGFERFLAACFGDG